MGLTFGELVCNVSNQYAGDHCIGLRIPTIRTVATRKDICAAKF